MAKKRIRIGDKIVEIEHEKNGVPVIKARAEEIRHPDGHVDVVVHVPCMSLPNQSQS